MIFVFNNLKYDTDKMELISTKCEHTYISSFFGDPIKWHASNVKLFKSKKENWLLTYEKNNLDNVYGVALSEEKAKNLLLNYDLEVYEKLFGELEEA